MIRADIDIDVPNRDEILSIIEHIPASIVKPEHSTKHNSGVYCQEIPRNPFNGRSSLDYKEADSRGYFKLDLLNNTLYKDVKDLDHLDNLTNTEPAWEMLEHKQLIDSLVHIKGHSHVVKWMKPKSVMDLAICIALIRPGKKYLFGKSREQIDREIWLPTEEYYFKKAHAVSYAMAITVQMNLLLGV